VVWLVTLLISHKIAGPMYRFEHDIQAIAEGDLRKRIRIRGGDQFAAMAASLNAMADSLNGKLIKVDDSLARLAGQARELGGPLASGIEECQKTLRDEFRLQ